MNKKTMCQMLFGGLLICGLYLILAPCHVLDNDNLASPKYIYSVFPEPGAEVSFSCYNGKNLGMLIIGPLRGTLQSGGIIVDMRPMFLTEWEIHQTDQAEEPPIYHRIFLYVDGEELSKSWDWEGGGEVVTFLQDGSEVNSGLPGSYIFGSNPFLFFGDHTAKVVIETLSGEILEYEWQFTITFP